MMIDTWLRIGAIGLPLVGALIIWRLGDKFLHVQRWLVGILLGTTGLIALALFLLNKYYACTLLTGPQNCLFDGLATLSLFFLNLVLIKATIILRGEDKGYDYMLMLLLSSAWAGMGLAENLLVLIVFLYLFFFVLSRWFKKKGFKGGFLKFRDDFEDDQK